MTPDQHLIVAGVLAVLAILALAGMAYLRCRR